MEKKDIRVVKTQRALMTALMGLLEKQDFQSITVNDLCAEAMVSRTTFYVHFEDKYALLEHCMETLRCDILPEGQAMAMPDRIRDMLERVQANVRVFKNLMMVHHDEELYKKIQQALNRELDAAMARRGEDGPRLPGPTEIVTAFCAAGVTNAIMLWVRGHLQYSTDEMARCLCALLPIPAVWTDGK